MSTRGSYGFIYKNTSILMFNHFDSYPSGIGVNILEFIKNINDNDEWDKLKKIISKVDFKENGYGSFNIKIDEFLSRLYDNKIEEFEIDNTFIKDSLFCEYAYIINLDSMKLEFYRGFQKKPQIGNRFGVEPNSGYYPCRLVAVFDLYDDIYGIEEKMVKISKNDIDDSSVSKYFRKLKLKKIHN